MLAILISIVVVVVVILVLSRLINRWLVDLIGQRAYIIIFWPGVLVHELSHLVAALLTFTKVMGVSLWPKRPKGGRQELGSVTHESTSNPFKLIIISLFPLVGGILISWLVAWWLLPEFPAVPLVPLGADSWLSLVDYFSRWFSFIWQIITALNLTAWQTWLFFYLILSLAAHLVPSPTDLNYALAGLVALALFCLLLWLLAGLLNYPFGQIMVFWLDKLLVALTPFFSYILALLLAVAVLTGLAALLKRLNKKQDWS
ncbi:hypothetical protein KKC17_00550 [Patescibacteria group bacterium]|nr:hypothetical protein [Patescibacteria group bacterium]